MGEHGIAKHPVRSFLRKAFFIFIGAVMMALALEAILIPNSMMDGGIVGVSILLSHLTPVTLGAFIFVLNIPFFIIGYKQIGKTFALLTGFGIVVLSVATSMMHHIPTFVNDPFAALITGGVLLGAGVGLVIRNGGALDGTEILAILLSKKLPFSVGDIVLFINLFIFTAGGFTFGWLSAIYSFAAYYIAARAMDTVIKGMDESMLVWVISDDYEEIAEMIRLRLGRGVTLFDGSGGFSKEKKQIIFCVINRLEEAKMKELVTEVDARAFVAVSTIAEVRGGNFKKRDIH